MKVSEVGTDWWSRSLSHEKSLSDLLGKKMGFPPLANGQRIVGRFRALRRPVRWHPTVPRFREGLRTRVTKALLLVLINPRRFGNVPDRLGIKWYQEVPSRSISPFRQVTSDALLPVVG